MTPGIKYLLIANALVYILEMSLGSSWMVENLGLVPNAILNNLSVWQLVTYMFLHGGFFHILFNMFALWMFGTDLERQWGTRFFLKFYFICGIGAGIITFFLQIYSSVPTIGASGAIFGVLVAFAMTYPNREIMMFPFFIPIKAKWLVTIMIGIGIFAAWSNKGDGIAHFTHLGGALIGYVYLKQDWRLGRLFVAPFKRLKFFRRKRKAEKIIQHNRKSAELMDEVDKILDRINEVGGYENLTDREKRVLENAAKKLSDKQK